METSAEQTTQAITIPDLIPDTTYQFRVEVTDTAGNITYSENQTLTTEPTSTLISVPTSVAPIVENLIAGTDKS